MSNAVADYRIVLDETSLDFRRLSDSEAEGHLDNLNNALIHIQRGGMSVWVHPWIWDAIECRDGTLLCDFVYDPKNSQVSPDTRRLLAILLDKCQSWPEDELGCLDTVQLQPPTGNGSASSTIVDPALSIGVALARGLAGRSIACLVFGGSKRRGFWKASTTEDSDNLFFFATPVDLPLFWRSLFGREQVKEHEFFALGQYAFPNLILHPDLDFGRFDGNYLDLRDKVTRILAAINDEFTAAMRTHSGIPAQVAAALGHLGLDLSPESPSTRSSSKLMAQRTVQLSGESYRCEWHAKLERHRNRIHFALPNPALDGRILVGIFIDHLDT